MFWVPYETKFVKCCLLLKLDTMSSLERIRLKGKHMKEVWVTVFYLTQADSFVEKRVCELGQRRHFQGKKNKVGVICVREIKNTILKYTLR